MRCLSVLLRLDQLRTGEMDVSEQERVREHLRSCGSCDDSFDEVERFARSVTALLDEPAPKPSYIDEFDEVATSAGRAWVVFSPRGLRMISTSAADEAELRAQFTEVFNRCLRRGRLPEEMADVVRAAIEGKMIEKPAVDLSGLPPFEQKVLTAISAIPHGEVRTYSWVARTIGHPRAVRAVGNALHRNPVAPVVPCHRVVPAAGGTGNYAGGAVRKRELLRREGVAVAELDALARSRVRFYGAGGVYCHPTCSRLREIPMGERFPLHSEQEAVARGFEPCSRCWPREKTA